MLHFLKQLVKFRIGQKAGRGFAKSIGLRKASSIIGLVAGIKAVRRHRHA